MLCRCNSNKPFHLFPTHWRIDRWLIRFPLGQHSAVACVTRFDEGQLLGDGWHGSLRTVLGAALRPHRWPRGGSPCQPGRPGRARDLEPRVHPVQSRGGRVIASPAAKTHRLRHGVRATRVGHTGTSGRWHLGWLKPPRSSKTYHFYFRFLVHLIWLSLDSIPVLSMCGFRFSNLFATEIRDVATQVLMLSVNCKKIYSVKKLLPPDYEQQK